MPRHQNIHPEDLKSLIRKKYGSMYALSQQYPEINYTTLQCAVHRPQPSGNIIIADALGESLHALWPKWFDVDGNRINVKRKTKVITNKIKSQRQKCRSK